MHTLKIVTTTLIWILIFIIFAFIRNLIWTKDKASIVGFSFMEIVYILSLICMWA